MAAMIACIHRGVAVVAVSQQVRNARHTAGDRPELLCGRAADNRKLGNRLAFNEFDERFVAAAGLERPPLIANKPRSHRIVGSLSAQRLKEPAARSAAVSRSLGVAAIWTDQHLGL